MAVESWRETRERRLLQVNALVAVIAVHGRRFFSWKSDFDRMEMDARGRLWWIQCWNAKRLYLHGPGPTILRRGFSHGGTLRELVLCLREYVLTGKQIWERGLGPWKNHPDEDGGLWGYYEQMETIRIVARSLGILAEAAACSD